jgi:hypothetical protein
MQAKILGLVLASVIAVAPPSSAVTVVPVPGGTSIYQVFGHSGSFTGDARDAVLIGFAAGNNVFRITATGGVGCCGGSSVGTADGGYLEYSNIDAWNGISGSVGIPSLGLVGVFTSDTDPYGSTPPDPLPWDGDNPTSLSPLLNQVFYIGDGRAGRDNPSGAVLSFTAPPSATRLYLGFADAPYWTGPPGWYGDDPGSVEATIERNPVPAGLASLSLKQHTVAGCKSVTGTVTLSGPAPTEGIVVSLSDTLASASTPATSRILAGATTRTFTVTTAAVATEEAGTVSATLGGATLSQDLVVRPMGLLSVTLSPSTVPCGKPVAGTAKLECKAGPGAVTLELSGSNAAAAYPVAASIAVPQGLQSVAFDVATNPVLSKTTASISASANATTKSRTLTVTPAASVTPTSLRFGNVAVNTTSAALSTTLYNKGAAAYSIVSIGLTGTSAKYFAQSNDCPADLDAGASCTVAVTFTPTVTGGKSARLSIATGATSTPISVSLSGTGL